MSGAAAAHGWLATRWQRWWMARVPPGDQLRLTQRNIYILPTGAGWMLALTLLILLVASINFQLNLGYLLTFLLAGCAAVSTWVSHATLRGLQLVLLAPAPQFAGTSVRLQVQLINTRARGRHGVALSLRQPRLWSWTDVPPQGSAALELSFAPARRGLQQVPPLAVQTLYPMGLFRVWAWWRPKAQVLVYPEPEPACPPLPAGEPLPGQGGAASSSASSEHGGVRAYRRGDAQRLIVWKKAAQALASGSDALVSRDAQADQRSQLWLSLQSTSLRDTEAALSRLTAWVLQADRLGLSYGLRLGTLTVAQGSGPAQRERCLHALAVH
ncbi:DUF58 domain-containing protein [Comamonas sp. NLF-1-9]|uniref:DUF58 domain-containing protein n=1 Tax=Comamonas sp. NLF-1-9 TaxID=2853163 RepID=UPI001C43E404|nr:DUF58 domain-containing protein [Comamonas sp. NLF-1-9]QXL85022.1 DUF58 domain-containing protein [Comamonas sp. NLF-1-9]